MAVVQSIPKAIFSTLSGFRGGWILGALADLAKWQADPYQNRI
jgi:hypothetical protein